VEDEHNAWSNSPDACYVYLVDTSISGEEYVSLGGQIQISVSVDPSNIGTGTARLSKSCSGSGNVNVYRMVDGNLQLLTLPWSWPLSHGTLPSPLYVEGTAASSAVGDVTLTLAYVASGQTMDSDSMTLTVGVQMRLEKVGNTEIDASHEYSENTTIRVTALFADGTPCTGFTGTVNIAEDQTVIYTQHTDKGAFLPSTVEITSGGTATFVARSLADPLTEGTTPPDPAFVKTTNYPVYNSEGHLAVPQWVDLEQVDTSLPNSPVYSSGPVYDWFETRTMWIFDNASGDADIVFTRVISYSQFSGSHKGETPQDHSAQQSIALNPHWTEMRLNIPDSDYGHTCQVQMGPDHSQTVLHEARHAYQDWLTTQDLGQPNDRTEPGTPNNDDDRDWLVDTVTIDPKNFLLDTDASREKCVGTIAFGGDNSGDIDNEDEAAVNDWDYVAERDSEEFAALFYNYVP